MAVAFNALTAALYDSAAATTYPTAAAYTPTANALVLAAVIHSDAAPEGACTSFSGNGGTWVRIGEVAYDTIASNLHRVCLWRTMVASPTSTVGTLTLPDTGTGGAVRVVEFTGVDTSGTNGSGAIVQVVTNVADATANPNVNLAALDASGNNAVFAVVGGDVNTVPFYAPEASWTEDQEGGYGTPATRMGTYYRLATTDNTVVVTAVSHDWGIIAVEVKAASSGTDLVIQDAAHAHTSDGIALTQAHNLVVADAGHGHSSDLTALTQAHNLTVQDATHGHLADNVALTQVHGLAVADALHGHTADNTVLTGGSTLVVQDAVHAHAADNLGLTQAHNLAVQDGQHVHGYTGVLRANTPDSAALSITGDIDLRAAVSMGDWTPGANQTFVAKGANDYILRMGSANRLQLVYHDGSVSQTRTAQVGTLPVSDGGILCIRATLDVDNGASGNDAAFYYKQGTTLAALLDNSGWTQWGTTVTTAATTVIRDTAATLEVGARNAGVTDLLSGAVYAAVVQNGINGTVVARPDFTGGGNTDTAGNTWTVTAPDALILTQVHSLAVQDAAHSHSADNLVLTQAHALAVADSLHAHAADNLALTFSTTLVIQDATHAHAADSLTLTQVHQLAVQEALHAQAADSLTLTQAHALAVQDAVHSHTADNLALTFSTTLVIQDGQHGHTADSLTLSQVHQLAVADGGHAHLADNIALTQVHSLGVQDALHAQAAENVVLSVGAVTLAIQDAAHAHSADGLALTQVHALQVQDAAHAQAVDNVALTQAHNLAIADALHTQAAENLVLTGGSVLAVQDAVHAHTADGLVLTQVHVLQIQDGQHGHTVDNVTLSVAATLAIQDGLHAHTAENLVLTGGSTLVIQDATHAHAADGLSLTQVHVLVIADASHGHTVDSPALTQAQVLAIADALHSHLADNVALFVGQYGTPVSGPTRADLAPGDQAILASVLSAAVGNGHLALVGAGTDTVLVSDAHADLT